MDSTNVSIRMDVELKKQAEELFFDLGLNMTTAMIMFLKQAVRSQGIPFEISRVPNADTLIAIAQADAIARDGKVKGHTSMASLLGALKA